MSAFALAPEVYDDIWIIWEYLAREAGVEIANRIEAELFAGFEVIGRTPGVGHRREDLTGRDVFFYAVEPYLIVFRKRVPVQITGVFHGRRNVKGLLSARLG